RTSSRAATMPTASANGSASRTWASPQRRSWKLRKSGRSKPEDSRYHSTVEPLLDRLNRPLETLRVSVTDRCNFRCVYCMPKEVYGRDHAFLERKDLLSLEEIARVAAVFARLGVRTLRLTGGEPLVRRNIEHLV